MAGLPGTVLDIPGYLVSRDPWDSMPGGTTRDCPGYPGLLSISDPWDSMHGGTTRDCPGYPGILSISGSMGLHAWRDYPGLSWVSRDT